MKYKTTEDTNNILLAQYIKYRSYFVPKNAYLVTTDSLVAGITKMQKEGIPRNKAIHALSARQKLFEVNKYLIDGQLDIYDDPYGLSYSFAVEALLRAIDTYEFNRGVTFTYYASNRIRHHILDGIRACTPHVRMNANTSAQHKPIFDVYDQLRKELDREVSYEEVATRFIENSPLLEMDTLPEIIKFVEKTLGRFTEVVLSSDIEDVAAQEYYIEHNSVVLNPFIESLLTEKSKQIIDCLWGITYYPRTHQQTADELGVTLDEVFRTEEMVIALHASAFAQ